MSKTKTLATLLLCLFSISAGKTLAQEGGGNEPAQAQAGSTAATFSQIPRGVPIVMLNMLKFRELADYPEDQPAPEGVSSMRGVDAYQIYREAASKLVAQVGGETVWRGHAKAEVIAPAGEEWDEVFLVRYPSIEVFLKMVSSEPYRKIVKHRSAALADSRLIATVEITD